jgi:drug/metabolite transporter (DMT)-like permease
MTDRSATVEAAHDSRPALWAYGLLVAGTISWAANLVIGRAFAGSVGPLTLSWVRWAIAVAVMLPFALPELLAKRAVLRRHFRLLLVLAVLGFSCSNSLCYLALQETTALNASLINSVGPVMIFAGAIAVFGEPYRARHVVGVAVSLIGVLVIVARGDLGGLAVLESGRGDLLMLLGVLTWTVYSLMLRYRPPELSTGGLVAILFLISAVTLTPFAAWEAWRIGLPQATPATLSGLLYVGIFPSVLSILCWNRAIALIGARRASTFTHLIPLFSAGLAMLFLGERVELFHLAGAALIFGGILLAAQR